MKIVADESVDYPIVLELRLEGYEILSILENYPGISDEEVLRISNQQNSLLLTVDKDFGEMVYRLKQIHKGVILIRLEGQSMKNKILITKAAFKEYKHKLLDSFTVISSTSIRIRSNKKVQ